MLLSFRNYNVQIAILWDIKIKLFSEYVKIWWERNALTEITQGSELREKGGEMLTVPKVQNWNADITEGGCLWKILSHKHNYVGLNPSSLDMFHIFSLNIIYYQLLIRLFVILYNFNKP
jgi:hypothetical protein